MKQPDKIKQEHVKCVSCGKPIHISEFAGISKKGFYHDNMVCLMDLAKDLEPDNNEELISKRIRNQLRIHWFWLKNKDYNEVADFIDATIRQVTKPKEPTETKVLL